jgi:hypothetical protein
MLGIFDLKSYCFDLCKTNYMLLAAYFSQGICLMITVLQMARLPNIKVLAFYLQQFADVNQVRVLVILFAP